MSGTLTFKAPHLHVVQPPPASESRLRTASVEVMRDGSRYQVRLQTYAGGDAWISVNKETLRTLIAEANKALEVIR